MKKFYLVLYLIISSSTVFTQNYFPVKAGDTLLYRRQYYSVLLWDSYIKQIVEEAVFDNFSYYKICGQWYRYDQPNQKLYTYENGKQLLSVDFNPGSSFVGSIMGLTRNFHSSLTTDSLISGISDSIPYSGLWLTHIFKFKNNLGYTYDYDMVQHTDYMDVDTYNLIEARGSSYSLLFEKPTLSVGPVPLTKNINEFPFYINYSQTHPYPALIDTLCVFINVYRNDSLIIQRYWQDISKTYFKVAVTPSQIKVGDIIKLNFLLSDSSLSCNKVWMPLNGSYNITVTNPTDVKDEENISYYLDQNYPNPFNPNTTIKFSIPHATHVTLSIYNSMGQEVLKLISKDMNPGIYNTEWKANGFASGVYFYRIVAGGFVETKKLLLLK